MIKLFSNHDGFWRDQPVSLSVGTPKLLELSLIKASAELVKVCGESVRSGPLEESNRSKEAATASFPPKTKTKYIVNKTVFRKFYSVCELGSHVQFSYVWGKL